MKSELLHKKYKDKLIKVEWYDATQRDMDEEYLTSLTGKESGMDLLLINTTYGKIGAILDDVIIIIHEESASSRDGTDTTMIPRTWIKEPKEFKK